MQRVHKIIPLAVVAVLWLLYFVCDIPEMLKSPSLASACVYHFFHASLIHLIVNSTAIYILLSRKFSVPELCVAYVIASASFFVSNCPVIGFSNILYAIMGLRTPSLKSSWWRSTNTIIFLVVTFAYLLFPKVSAITHIVSFAAGVSCACVRRVIISNNIDYDKARGRK